MSNEDEVRNPSDEPRADGGQVGPSVDGTEHWQVVEITGVGSGEMWYETVQRNLRREKAESEAAKAERTVAVPMPHDPDEPVGIGEVVDDYARGVVEQ